MAKYWGKNSPSGHTASVRQSIERNSKRFSFKGPKFENENGINFFNLIDFKNMGQSRQPLLASFRFFHFPVATLTLTFPTYIE